MVERAQRRMRLILTLLCMLCMIWAGWLAYALVSDGAELHQRAFALAQSQAAAVAQGLDVEMSTLAMLADNLANNLALAGPSGLDLEARLQADLDQHPTLYGMGVAFTPDVLTGDERLYAPYLHRNEQGATALVQLEDFYDYTLCEENDWYCDTLTGGANWNYTTYIDPAAGALLVEYRVPFTWTDSATGRGQAAGVVYADHSLETLKAVLRSLNLGEEGYSFLLAPDGQYLGHPDALMADTTIFDHAADLNDASLQQAGERALSGERFHRAGVDPVTGMDSWTFYQPLTVPGWSAVVIIDQNLLAPPTAVTVRRLIWLGLALIACAFLLSLLIFRVSRGDTANLWRAAVCAALLLAVSVLWIWYVILTHPIHATNDAWGGAGDEMLTSDAAVTDVLRQSDALYTLRGLPPAVRIPTGVTIRHLKFAHSDEIVVSGIIWQKYPLDLPEKVERTFTLPDSISGEPRLKEVYRFQEAGFEVIGWSFQSTLRQTFNTIEYPLDLETMNIEIWPQTLDHNMVLTPDLSAYEFINPSLLPGITPGLTVEGWDVKRSYFTYGVTDHNANFGSQRVIQRDATPDLVFSINLQRQLLSPIIAYGLTIVVVSALAFAILIFAHNEPSQVVTETSALFFVVAVTHLSMRGAIGANGVVYLESLLITLYVTILLSAIASLLACIQSPLRLIAFRDNLIPKLAYWPLLLAIFLAITLRVFYPPA